MRPTLLAGILAGSGGGGAVPSWINESFDFTNPAKMTFSSGSGSVGSVLATITSNDGLYTATTVAGAPTLAMSNGRLITNFNGASAMQVSSAMGLATSGQGAVIAVFEPTTNATGAAAFCCSTPSVTYSQNQYRLMFGGYVPGVQGIKADSTGSFQLASIPNATLTAGSGARIMGVRGFPGISAAEVFLDGATPVAGATGLAPSGMTTFTIGAEADGNNLSDFAPMNLTRVDICTVAPTNTQLTQYNNWVWATYPDVYGKPVAAAVIQRPVITTSTAGTSVSWTAGQMAGFPTPTVSAFQLSQNGAVVYTGTATSAAVTVSNGDVLDLVQTGTNANGSGSNSALSMIVGNTQYQPRVSGVGVSGRPLSVFVPLLIDNGATITGYRWYKNYFSTSNVTGQQLASTIANPVPNDSDANAGAIWSAEVQINNGQWFSTPNFGNSFVATAYGQRGLEPTIKAMADTSPTTATRPASSTGVGFFVSGNQLYDANGNRFKFRGLNANHYDSDPGTGLYTHSGANVVRIFFGPTDWSQLQTNLNAAVAAKMVVVPTIYNLDLSFFGGISGSTLTITSITGYGAVAIGSQIRNGSTVIGVVSAFGTGTGQVGTYTVTGAVTTAGGTSLYAAITVTGSSEPTVLSGIVQAWTQMASLFKPYEKYMIVNIANEYGNTATWQAQYATAISGMRTAGYLGTLMIDAPGSGQDTSLFMQTTSNPAAALLTSSDPQKNLLFSLHCYGNLYAQNGLCATLLQNLANAGISQSLAFCIGEFGPGINLDSGSPVDGMTTVTVCDATPLVGWMPWAWGDHRSSSPPEANETFCMVYNWYTGYSTGAAGDLMPWGQQILLNPYHGLQAAAVPATIF